MKPKSKDQIESEYADLLEDDHGDAWKLIHRLAAHYQPGDPLTRLPGPPADARASGRRWLQRILLPTAVSRFRPSLATGGATMVALLLSITAVLAASGILDLGKPTNAVPTNPYFPLSGFHRDTKLPTIPKIHGKAQVLFIGTLSPHELNSGPERWPMIKALEQFGRFSHIQAVDHNCIPNFNAPDICNVATYDWSSAAYSSKYVEFLHRDVIGLNDKPFQQLTRVDLALCRRLTRMPAVDRTSGDPCGVFFAASRGLAPIEAIGDYVENQTQIPLVGDFQSPSASTTIPAPWLSFQTVQSALATQKDPPGTSLVEDVNADANIITALICHADGNKPGKVCGRKTIESIVRRLH